MKSALIYIHCTYIFLHDALFLSLPFLIALLAFFYPPFLLLPTKLELQQKVFFSPWDKVVLIPVFKITFAEIVVASFKIIFLS